MLASILEDEIMQAWTFLTQHWTEIVAALGALVMGSRIIVRLTPTPQDDSFLEKIVNFLKGLGLKID